MAKLAEKGFACYRNFSTDIAESIAAGPVDKLVDGESYFIMPLVIGHETDAKRIGEHIVNHVIGEPRIGIVSTVVVEHCFGDDQTDTSVFNPGDELPLNGFRLEDMAITVITDCGKFDVSYHHFLAGIETIPSLASAA